MKGSEQKQNTGRFDKPNKLAEFRALLGDMPIRRDLLIEYLHRIQDHDHHISKAHIEALARILNLATTKIYEVATFYHHFDVVTDSAEAPPALTVRVCESLSCAMFGGGDLHRQLEAKLDDKLRIQAVPCVGRCHAAPVAVVGTNAIERANSDKVIDAVNNKALQAVIPAPISYQQYRRQGGYQTLVDCVQGRRKPDEVIRLLERAGLRGLGGAGFPAGSKWRILLQQPAPRLLAINIDEGEPGTFKDRHYLECDPHRFIEGSLIAHWAIAAEAIYIYLRDEYAGCRQMLEHELALLKRTPPCPLPEIHLRRGAGAYVCGEESAMIESIEGKRGIPRLRPPYLAEVGLFGRPTLAHNMETMHWVRDLLENGADWFTAHGRRGRQGLRSFSVSGRIQKPGVHLAPAGISLRELIDEYCEGMLPGHTLYGYFPGGASGGMLPASLADVPLDFDTLQQYGCFIGSAAIIVFSDKDSARALAVNAMKFFEHESCGQCTPCRIGTAKAVKLMEQARWDCGLLEELAVAMADASICGLGQAAPNPMRSAIKYFPEEFR